VLAGFAASALVARRRAGTRPRRGAREEARAA
jgi:hypothetical protein